VPRPKEPDSHVNASPEVLHFGVMIDFRFPRASKSPWMQLRPQDREGERRPQRCAQNEAYEKSSDWTDVVLLGVAMAGAFSAWRFYLHAPSRVTGWSDP
jgi:hypothetical protein